MKLQGWSDSHQVAFAALQSNTSSHGCWGEDIRQNQHEINILQFPTGNLGVSSLDALCYLADNLRHKNRSSVNFPGTIGGCSNPEWTMNYDHPWSPAKLYPGEPVGQQFRQEAWDSQNHGHLDGEVWASMRMANMSKTRLLQNCWGCQTWQKILVLLLLPIQIDVFLSKILPYSLFLSYLIEGSLEVKLPTIWTD